MTTFSGNFLGLFALGLGPAKGPGVEVKGRVSHDPSSFNFSQNHCRLWSQCDYRAREGQSDGPRTARPVESPGSVNLFLWPPLLVSGDTHRTQPCPGLCPQCCRAESGALGPAAPTPMAEGGYPGTQPALASAGSRGPLEETLGHLGSQGGASPGRR